MCAHNISLHVFDSWKEWRTSDWLYHKCVWIDYISISSSFLTFYLGGCLVNFIFSMVQSGERNGWHIDLVSMCVHNISLIGYTISPSINWLNINRLLCSYILSGGCLVNFTFSIVQSGERNGWHIDRVSCVCII